MARSHFFTLARIIWKGHILNPLWLSRDERRFRRGQATREAVLKYLDRHMQPVELPQAPAAQAEVRQVWTLWLQGMDQAPAIVRRCVDSMKRIGTRVNVLDQEQILQLISLPPYILDKWQRGLIRSAHFADICRVELLYQYGGVWADATDYFHQGLPQWLWEQDFFVYLAGTHLQGSYASIQNCFIRARKGNPLLGAWREAIFQYWEQEDSAADYFIHQLLFQWVLDHNPAAAAHFAQMPQLEQDPTHVLWFQRGRAPYQAIEVDRICQAALFQKTEYKSALAQNPPIGSIAAWLQAPIQA